MLRAKRDDNPVVPRPLRPLKLADAERTISLTWLDLGSVSTGYSDRPVARAIKIKHAGLNLTGHVVHHTGGKPRQWDDGPTCGPIGLGRYAQQDRVRVKPGETYRQPQAASVRWRVSSAIALELVSRKLQASSLTTCPGYDRMNLERKNYETRKKQFCSHI